MMVCRPQGAMKLSEAQKGSLRECRSKLMADTELAQRRRADLLQQLGCRMIGDDRRSMERLAVVRDPPVVSRSNPGEPTRNPCS